MTKIEWTEQTWNPIAGCTKVSPGCANCYAERMAKRLRAMGQEKYAAVVDDRGHWTGAITFDYDALLAPLKRHKPTMYFVNSMSDLFHEAVPDHFIDEVFAVMALCPQHTFQVLTKRAERMREWYCRVTDRHDDCHCRVGRAAHCIMYPDAVIAPQLSAVNLGIAWPLPNVWLGTSVENQQYADERIPHLIECQAAVRFLSCEPLLGPIRKLDLDGIHWVIVGGESGPGARPCDIEWIRDIVQQCQAAGVPCFVKQLGGHPNKRSDPFEWPEDLRVREYPMVAA